MKLLHDRPAVTRRHAPLSSVDGHRGVSGGGRGQGRCWGGGVGCRAGLAGGGVGVCVPGEGGDVDLEAVFGLDGAALGVELEQHPLHRVLEGHLDIKDTKSTIILLRVWVSILYPINKFTDVQLDLGYPDISIIRP